MDEKIYRVGVIVLLMGELLFAVPTMLDSIVNTEDVMMVFYLLMAHIFLFIYGVTLKLDSRSSEIHMWGSIAFMGSFFPYVGFVLHAVTSYVIIKRLKKYYGKLK